MAAKNADAASKRVTAVDGHSTGTGAKNRLPERWLKQLLTWVNGMAFFGACTHYIAFLDQISTHSNLLESKRRKHAENCGLNQVHEAFPILLHHRSRHSHRCHHCHKVLSKWPHMADCCKLIRHHALFLNYVSNLQHRLHELSAERFLHRSWRQWLSIQNS